MNNTPTIRIAKFGTRGTGKTTFVSSFVKPDNSQCAYLTIPDEKTKEYLFRNWQRVEAGSVPGATAMNLGDELRLTLRYMEPTLDPERVQDEDVWRIEIQDYSGKLAEGGISFGEEVSEDEMTKEFRNAFYDYVRDSDAVLFLVPVDIAEWSTREQTFYLRCLMDIIEIAKEERGLYSASIPFCMALMKWDQLDIPSENVPLSPDGNFTIDPQTERFLTEHKLFRDIYDAIRKTSHEKMMIFPASAFGSHLASDKKLPDPDNLEPLNVIPILYWLCRQAEDIRIRIAEKMAAGITNSGKTMDDAAYTELQTIYDTLLENGLNDPEKRGEIQKLAQENRTAHIRYMSGQTETRFTVIDGERHRNRPAEKVKVLQDLWDRKLYFPEDEVKLQHDLRDWKARASRRNFVRFVENMSIFLFLAAICGVGWFGWQAIDAYRHFTQGESYLAKTKITGQDLDNAEPHFSIPYIPFENYIPEIKGRRDKFREMKRDFEQKKDAEIETALAPYAVSSEMDLKSVCELWSKKLETIDKLCTDGTRIQREKLDAQKEKTRTELELYRKLSEIETADDTNVLHLIEDFANSAERARFPEISERFGKISEKKRARIMGEFEDRLAAVPELAENDKHNFTKQHENAVERQNICKLFLTRFPDTDNYRSERTRCETILKKSGKEIEEYKKHEPLKAAYDKIPSWDGTSSNTITLEFLKSAREFLGTYTLEQYPYGKELINEILQKEKTANDMLKEQWSEQKNAHTVSETDALQQRISKAEARTKIHNEYIARLPEGSPLRAMIVAESEEDSSFITQYGPMAEEWNQIPICDTADPSSITLLYFEKAEDLLKKYPTKEYPFASEILKDLQKNQNNAYETIKADWQSKKNAHLTEKMDDVIQCVSKAQKRIDIHNEYIARLPEGSPLRDMITNELNADTLFVNNFGSMAEDYKQIKGMAYASRDYFEQIRKFYEIYRTEEYLQNERTSEFLNHLAEEENLAYSKIETDWKNEISVLQDRSTEELVSRMNNADKLQKSCEDHKDKLPEDTKLWNDIETVRMQSAVLSEELEKLKKFEDAKNGLDLKVEGDSGKLNDKITAVKSFLSEYNAPLYVNYQNLYSEVSEALDKMEIENDILGWLDRLNELEKEMEKNSDQFSKHFDACKGLEETHAAILAKPNANKTDERLKNGQDRLNELKKKNNENWEMAEWEKVQNVIGKFETSWKAEDLANAIDRLNTYLTTTNSPKNRSAYAQKMKAYYTEWQKQKGTVKIDWVYVGLAGQYKNYWGERKLQLTVGNISFQTQKEANRWDIANQSKAFSLLNNNCKVNVKLENIERINAGGTGTASFHDITKIFTNNTPSFTSDIRISDAEGNRAIVRLIISGYPIRPAAPKE